MEPFTSNLVHSSFEYLLHLYDLHLVSRYKLYEASNYLFNSIYYLLNNQSSSLQLKQKKWHI